MTAVTMAITDGWTIAKRNTLKIRRAPDWLGFLLLSPIMFVLLFNYVFGSAIHIPGTSYREFLLAGIFAQTAIFGAQLSGYGLIEDLQKGSIDRFRSLPMSPAAVLIGRTTSDMLMNAVSLAVMAVTGLVVGWRIHSSPAEAVLGFVMLLLLGYVFSWVVVMVGLALRTPEAFNNASMVLMFPLTFVANTFVQSSGLPQPLRAIAEWSPVSAFTQAVRELFGNTNAAMPEPTAWPLQHPVVAALLWTVALLAISIPVATWLYRTAVSR
ncbi:ABC transporter permease [Fodinicola acaciae]|uniref:ABC transporter permease n=1 Tax=Fodinicola acaciae TaxID=2681555 RepID=UPI0013D41F58|nr:ABC transporter permease [Fodinicola acaciae]